MAASAYRGWVGCGLGSTVTTEDVQEMAPGIRMISSTSMTLCALDAEKATVDMVVRNRVEGTDAAFPPTEVLQEVVIPADPPEPENDPAAREGDETLDVAGRRIPCHWTVRCTDIDGRRLTVKTWTSGEVPGGLVRAETGFDDGPTSLSVVVSFLKK